MHITTISTRTCQSGKIVNAAAPACQQQRVLGLPTAQRSVTSTFGASWTAAPLSITRPVAGQAQRQYSQLLRAVASDAPPAESTSATEEEEVWHALVCNAAFLLNDVQNEAVAEQLREKKRFFGEQGKALDFFIVSEPAWLDTQFPEKAALVKRPCVALISTDKTWITFMKLRLDRVLKLELAGLKRAEVFKSNGPVPKFTQPTPKYSSPYPSYAYGWWEAFFPENMDK